VENPLTRQAAKSPITAVSAEQTVTITRVRVYNYDALWLDSSYEYGFESYMLEKGAFTTSEAGQTWSKGYI